MMEATNSESGYTLLETVVSLSLFVGVLIPVIGMASSLLLDGRVEERRNALRIAQTSLVEAQPNDGITVYSTEDGFEVQREVLRTGRLVQVKVAIFRKTNPPKEIVGLHRSLIDYSEATPQ